MEYLEFKDLYTGEHDAFIDEKLFMAFLQIINDLNILVDYI